MKIKLAILEKDQSYLNRIVSVFSAKYAEKLEIYSFTDLTFALAYLESAKIDVFLANDAFEIDMSQIPRRCAFAYFVDSADIAVENEQRAICKFQKAELIYKQILSVYSEKAGSISGFKLGDDTTKTIVFTSVSGGSGASTMAAAFSVRQASQGKKVLYLNVEKYGSSDSFFKGEGGFDMSDIVFVLKSKKANLALKLESCVKQDVTSGVYFYSASKVALDVMELNSEEIMRLVSELRLTGSYDYIVLDMDFGLDEDKLKMYRQANHMVWVGDGSLISNTKIARAYEALSIIEQNAEVPLMNKMVLIYNKFSNKTGKALVENAPKTIGGAPRYEHATTEQILKQLSAMTMFDEIA